MKSDSFSRLVSLYLSLILDQVLLLKRLQTTLNRERKKKDKQAAAFW